MWCSDVVKVFSDIVRTDSSPAEHNEGTAKFLDRAAGPFWDQIRELIEDWFTRLDPEAQADVRGRLRDRDDRQFNGAFFELYLNEALLRMGYKVTCHPTLEGSNRRPDFLAEKDGNRVYIEARAASSSNIAVGNAARVNTVYESLDKLDSPNFFLWIDIDEQGPQPLGARPLRKQLEKWLAELDSTQVNMNDLDGDVEKLPTYTYSNTGWDITFRAIPKPPASRGKPGLRPLGVFSRGKATLVNDDEDIRGALKDKGTAYGDLGAAFVVAVRSDSLTLDEHDVLNALYGTEMMEIYTHPDGTHTSGSARKPDGYWHRGDHWAHTGVSAVLVVKNLHYAYMASQKHTIWHHPQPDVPAPEFPMWRRSDVDETGHMVFTEPDATQGTWFGLPDPWPVGEAFPKD